LDGVAVGRVELKGLLVIGDGEPPVAVVHVSFREAVIYVELRLQVAALGLARRQFLVRRENKCKRCAKSAHPGD
jgi:hypothetical protein